MQGQNQNLDIGRAIVNTIFLGGAILKNDFKILSNLKGLFAIRGRGAMAPASPSLILPLVV